MSNIHSITKRISPLVLILGLAACAAQPTSQATAKIGAKTLNVGQAALSAGHPEMSIGVANAVLRRNPKNVQAWVLKSTAEYESGDIQGAEAAAGQAVTLAPRDVGANMALGRAYANTDPKRALQSFELAHAGAPDAVGPAIDLGVSYIQNGYGDKGVKVLQQVVNAHPNNQTAVMDLALAMTVRNHPGDALRAAALLRPLADQPNASGTMKSVYDYISSMAGEPAR